MTSIVTVAASKGGVGKSTLAYDLAWLLDAPLIDLDWDQGGVTRRWGDHPRVRSPLLTALDSGTVPALLPGRVHRKPDLVPGHPEFASRQPAPEVMADALAKWAAAWGKQYVVVDTHPGAAHSGHGAMLAADVVVVPVVLGTFELNALEGMLAELADYPLLLVPSKVPRGIPQPELRRLRKLVEQYPTQVGPVVPYCPWITTRKRRAAVTAEDPTPARAAGLAAGFRDVAESIGVYVGG